MTRSLPRVARERPQHTEQVEALQQRVEQQAAQSETVRQRVEQLSGHVTGLDADYKTIAVTLRERWS